MTFSWVRKGIVLFFVAAAATVFGQSAPNTPATMTQASSPVDEAAQYRLLQQAVGQIKAGMNAQAINGPLAQIIQTYETAYAHSPKRIYCAESLAESVYYLVGAAKNHQNAIVLNKPTWALAYYLRGYAYGSMGDLANAETSLKQALQLSPSNSQYLSELGNVYENRKDWDAALKTFQAADTATSLARPEVKIPRRCHALRGEGYVLVELHRLDEAAQKYDECLAISPGDPASLRELGYVKRLQTQ